MIQSDTLLISIVLSSTEWEIKGIQQSITLINETFRTFLWVGCHNCLFSTMEKQVYYDGLLEWFSHLVFTRLLCPLNRREIHMNWQHKSEEIMPQGWVLLRDYLIFYYIHKSAKHIYGWPTYAFLQNKNWLMFFFFSFSAPLPQTISTFCKLHSESERGGPMNKCILHSCENNKKLDDFFVSSAIKSDGITKGSR